MTTPSTACMEGLPLQCELHTPDPWTQASSLLADLGDELVFHPPTGQLSVRKFLDRLHTARFRLQELRDLLDSHAWGPEAVAAVLFDVGTCLISLAASVRASPKLVRSIQPAPEPDLSFVDDPSRLLSVAAVVPPTPPEHSSTAKSEPQTSPTAACTKWCRATWSPGSISVARRVVRRPNVS
jgi:hypothetical protein